MPNQKNYNGSACPAIARQAVETFIKTKETIQPPKDAGNLLNSEAGVFVTIEKGDELRGCIGTYMPVQKNICLEIIHNAISAASADSRFTPIAEEELPDLSYSVYLLDLPELATRVSELDPDKYGIMVMADGKSGLLLPGLPGIHKIEDQLAIVCRKAGINPKEENITIYRFTADKFSEK